MVLRTGTLFFLLQDGAKEKVDFVACLKATALLSTVSGYKSTCERIYFLLNAAFSPPTTTNVHVCVCVCFGCVGIKTAQTVR